MISKELLDEVLKEKIKRHNPSLKNIIDSSYDKEFNSLIINYVDNNGMTLGYMINIYELAHKCKKWALEREIDIVSGEQFAAFLIKDKQNTFNADTEIEAIFKACQWILDNKEQK